jgi:glycosyltransferase involved in cell wall biosynthesis
MQGILSADVLVVPTAAMQEPLEAFMHDRHLPARPVHVIPHGRPDWTGPPVVRPFSDPLRLLYPSHIGDHKNVDFLPKVLKDLNDAGLEARLTLTATEDESANGIALATWFEENRESVNFKGPVSWHEVRSLFLDHDILLFPSLSEAFGHPLIEGMTTGMPILASDCDWAREICGDAALYADPHDSREWVSAIEVIRQGGFRQNPIGLENATRFDWDRSAESYASLLLA